MSRHYHLRPNVHNMGDVSIEAGSLDNDVTIYRDPVESDHYDHLVHIEAPEDEDWTGEEAHGGFKPGARWYVYRDDMPAEVPEWADLAAVGGSMDIPAEELAEMFTSEEPAKRAQAWETIAGYYGWAELDSYSLVMSYAETARYIRRHIVTYQREVE